MGELEKLIAKAARENQREEARDRFTKSDLEREAQFLRGWAKGKPIIRQSDDSTFWAAGRWMTKISFKRAEALAKAGYAMLEGDAKKGGAVLSMRKENA